MQSNFIAVLFALASALTIAWGTVVRHRIAEQAPGDGSRFTNAPILTVISRPLWWAGTGTALLGYFLQTIALGFGTLLVVQPVLVLSLMFTLPLSALYDGRRISKTETFWSGALTVAVAVLVILGRP
ncbi:DMT family transporter, partial [Corynebacterium durum]